MSQDEPRKRRKLVIHIPRTRLAALVARPGGVWRDEAIAEATRRVEALRIPYMEVIDEMIGQLEAASSRQPQDERLMLLTQLSDRIITLAGTFGLTSLMEAAKRLCDLTQALGTRGIADRGQIAVHIRAIRLFGPLAQPVSEEAAQNVLSELRRVLQHFGIQIPDEPAPPPMTEVGPANKRTRH
jgi:hypothetical protein